MSGFRAVWEGLDWTALLDVALRVIPALICITLHELAHGLAAYRLGDNTAKDAGRLTLNPLASLDLMGLVAMVIAGFGWAKPVPVDMRNFSDPKKGMALTALAGPMMNLLIAVVFLFLYGLCFGALYDGGTAARAALQMIGSTAYLSLALGIFNMLPISPLDGSKIFFSFLSDETYYKLMRVERYGMVILLVLALTGATSGVLSAVTGWAYDKLFSIAQFAFDLVN